MTPPGHVALHLGGEDRALAALLDSRIHEFTVEETGRTTAAC
ncbi:MAG: hypothetical protein Q8M17_16140 [Actinomycetota bacterium]|nr:hypothetical protein [Actinomycetota bacterium]